MSSPMVNKDILYCWSTERNWYLGFYFGKSTEWPLVDCGWSWYMNVDKNEYRKMGWEWEQYEPFEKPAVGHRCLLQW